MDFSSPFMIVSCLYSWAQKENRPSTLNLVWWYFSKTFHAEYNCLPYAKFVYRLIAHKNMVAFKFDFLQNLKPFFPLLLALNFLESLTPFSNSDVQRGRSDVAGRTFIIMPTAPTQTAPPAVLVLLRLFRRQKTFSHCSIIAKLMLKILNYAG